MVCLPAARDASVLSITPSPMRCHHRAFIVSEHAALLDEAQTNQGVTDESPPRVTARSPLAHHLQALPKLLRQERSMAGPDTAVMDLPCFCLLSEHAVIPTLVSFASEQVRQRAWHCRRSR